MCVKLLQSCPNLCDPMDCSPTGSSVHGILQARILKWIAISSSRGSSWPRDQTHISYVSCIGRLVLSPLVPSGKHKVGGKIIKRAKKQEKDLYYEENTRCGVKTAQIHILISAYFCTSYFSLSHTCFFK